MTPIDELRAWVLDLIQKSAEMELGWTLEGTTTVRESQNAQRRAAKDVEIKTKEFEALLTAAVEEQAE